MNQDGIPSAFAKSAGLGQLGGGVLLSFLPFHTYVLLKGGTCETFL